MLGDRGHLRAMRLLPFARRQAPEGCPWRESALRAAGNTIASAVRALVVPSGGRLTQSVAGWLARSARR